MVWPLFKVPPWAQSLELVQCQDKKYVSPNILSPVCRSALVSHIPFKSCGDETSDG